jgi:uncharacterized SAM-dependent methyltransferase
MTDVIPHHRLPPVACDRDAMNPDVRTPHGGAGAPARLLLRRRGSKLFDAITRLPEYTRPARSILDAHAGRIAERSEADALVELGAGTARSHGCSSTPCLDRPPAAVRAST